MDAEFLADRTGEDPVVGAAAIRFVAVVDEFRRASEATADELRKSLRAGDAENSKAISDRLCREMETIGASLQALGWALGVGSLEENEGYLDDLLRSDEGADPAL